MDSEARLRYLNFLGHMSNVEKKKKTWKAILGLEKWRGTIKHLRKPDMLVLFLLLYERQF